MDPYRRRMMEQNSLRRHTITVAPSPLMLKQLQGVLPSRALATSCHPGGGSVHVMHSPRFSPNTSPRISPQIASTSQTSLNQLGYPQTSDAPYPPPSNGYSTAFLDPTACRRRLPPTPARRASSPRMLPTPPPSSPDFRAPSAQLLERRPSGRLLPKTPMESCLSSPSPSLGLTSSRYSTPDPVTPPYTQEDFHSYQQIPDVMIEASSRASSRPGSIRRIVPEVVESLDYDDKMEEEVEDVDTGCDEEVENDFTVPKICREQQRVVETPDEGVQSQCSSQSPSFDRIEQLASKSNSETGSVGGDALAHGLDPSLYSSRASPPNEPILIRRASAVTPGTVPSSSSFNNGAAEQPVSTGLGLLYCTIQHFPVRKRLRVNILKIEALAGQLKPEMEIHAQCRVSIPSHKTGKEQSSEVKRGRDPVYNQEFFFDNVTLEDLDTKSIHLGAYHAGGAAKLQKDVLIGECTIPLREIRELNTKREVKIIEEFKAQVGNKKLGKIHITSCIEKEARRLTINVKKADDLPRWGFLGAPDVCVKITVDQGGLAKTKCSRVLKSTTTAVYNEAVMFLFNPSKNELANTKITISVHDMQRTCTGDDIIGEAYLGVLAQDKTEVEQWKNTVEHMGKEYKGSHHLKTPQSSSPSVHVAEAEDGGDDE